MLAYSGLTFGDSLSASVTGGYPLLPFGLRNYLCYYCIQKKLKPDNPVVKMAINWKVLNLALAVISKSIVPVPVLGDGADFQVVWSLSCIFLPEQPGYVCNLQEHNILLSVHIRSS
jgi:hypothetical protein